MYKISCSFPVNAYLVLCVDQMTDILVATVSVMVCSRILAGLLSFVSFGFSLSYSFTDCDVHSF